MQAPCSHDREHVTGHQFISVGAVVAGAAAVAAAVDENSPIAGSHQGRDLVAPIAGMAEAAMEQDDG